MQCKYYRLRKEISYDGGNTWQQTDEYKAGGLVEFASSDCSMRIDAKLANGTYQIPCTSTTYTSTSITRNEVTSISGYGTITGVTIGGCVSSVGVGAFSGLPLENVVIEEGVTTIGGQAFRYNPNLKTVDLPSTITSIANFAFQIPTGSTTTAFETLTVRATTPPTIYSSSIVINNPGGLVWTIKVPAASVDAYKAASGWSSFSSRITSI